MIHKIKKNRNIIHLWRDIGENNRNRNLFKNQTFKVHSNLIFMAAKVNYQYRIDKKLQVILSKPSFWKIKETTNRIRNLKGLNRRKIIEDGTV